jgi:hypothetical protein
MRLLIAIISVCFISACATFGSNEGRPDWVNNADHGAVASSASHVRGNYYQEDLAFKRAVAQLAASKGVTVSSTTAIVEKADNNSASSSMTSTILLQIDGVDLAVEVIERWRNPNSNEFFIWVKLID